MSIYGSILSREYDSLYVQRLDVRDLIDQSRCLVTLVFPFIKLIRYIDDIIKWKNFNNSIMLLLIGNIIISCISYVVLLSFTSFILIILTLMGLLHRKTGILKKCFPSNNMDEFIVLPHDEAMHDLHTILVVVDLFVRNGCLYMLKFYEILRWENLPLSIIINSILFSGCVIISTLPLRFFILYVFNILFSVHLLIFLTNEKISDEDKPNLKDINVEETYSHNSELDTGFATDTESSGNGSISSDEDKEEDGTKSKMSVNNQDTESLQSQDGPSSIPSTSLSSNNTPAAESLIDDVDENIQMYHLEVNLVQSSNENTVKADIKVETKPVANTKVNAIVGKLMDLKKRRHILNSEKCGFCGQAYNSILKRKNICCGCGNHFCAKCCNFKVPRSIFGATAPAAQTETASVCSPCYESLLQKNSHSKDE